MGKNKYRNPAPTDSTTDEAEEASLSATVPADDTEGQAPIEEATPEDNQGVEATDEAAVPLQAPERPVEAIQEPAGETAQAEPETAASAPIEAPVSTAYTPGSIVDLSNAPATQPLTPSQVEVETIRHALIHYAQEMAKGKPMDPRVGAKHQKTLYNLLVQILKLDRQAFYAGWGALLEVVNRYRDGAFAETHVYRFFDHMTGFDTERRAIFRNLLHLAINTADPRGRQQALKLINLEHLVKTIKLPIADVAEKLLSYYTL